MSAPSIQHVINGQLRDGSGASIEVQNPAGGQATASRGASMAFPAGEPT